MMRTAIHQREHERCSSCPFRLVCYVCMLYTNMIDHIYYMHDSYSTTQTHGALTRFRQRERELYTIPNTTVCVQLHVVSCCLGTDDAMHMCQVTFALIGHTAQKDTHTKTHSGPGEFVALATLLPTLNALLPSIFIFYTVSNADL